MKLFGATQSPTFDYRALRLAMGVIALTLPLLVTVISDQRLESISASYYTNARDEFVGLMFVVSAFLFAYHGWTRLQAIASKLAAVGAAAVALFPTACKTCAPDFDSHIHMLGAGVLFSVLAYFFLGPFRSNTKGQGGKKGRRARVYLICGILIILSMLVVLVLPDDVKSAYRVVFWAETVALSAFGVGWIVSGKYFKQLADEDERLVLF